MPQWIRRATVVDGNTRVGIYAPDGSFNIVANSAGRGIYHPSGAYRVTVTTDPDFKVYAPDGSLYIAEAVYLAAGGTPAGPTFVSAAVNGTSLAVTMSEALATTNYPATSTFTVLVNGTPATVSSLSASGSVVTLVLSASVGFGTTVTVAYTDPTAGDDTNALQAVDGRDAPSFTARPVTNNTPDIVYSTWNPSHKSSMVTLSNGDLTATYVGPTNDAYANVHGTGFRNTGKLYFEVQLFASGGYISNRAVGVARANALVGVGDYLGVSNSAVGNYGNGLLYQNGNTSSPSAKTFSSNDIIQVAVDHTAGVIWFGVGGVWGGTSNPATGTGGYNFRANIGSDLVAPAAGPQRIGDYAILNVGASAFANTIPAGFSAWG